MADSGFTTRITIGKKKISNIGARKQSKEHLQGLKTKGLLFLLITTNLELIKQNGTRLITTN